MAKNILWTAGKYLLACGVLIYVVYANWAPASGEGLRDVWQRHVVKGEPINGLFLLAAFTLHVFSMTTCIFRWYFLVRAQDLSFTILGALRIGTLGLLFNAFLPGSVGGDFIKAAALARGQRRRTVAVATVVMDRFMSLWGLILIVASVGTAFWFGGKLEGDALEAARIVVISTVSIVGVSSVLWILMGGITAQSSKAWADRLDRVPKIGGSLAQLWQAVWLYRSRPGSVVQAVALSTLSSTCDIVAFFFYARTLWNGQPGNPLPDLADHFLLVPLGLVVSAIPLFPGGMGVGELVFGELYKVSGSAETNGILASLLFRVSGWVVGILGYLLCLLGGVEPLPLPAADLPAKEPA